MPAGGSGDAARLELLDALFANAPLGLAILDVDQRYRYINAHMAEMNGVAAEAHLGHRLHELIADAPPELAEVLKHVLATGESVSELAAEAVIDGHQRSWLASFHPLRTDGRVDGIGVVAVEITTQAQAHDALRSSEAHLRLAVEAGRMGTWEWDFPAHRITWSDEMARMFGTTTNSFAGTVEAFASLVHPDDLAALEATMAEVSPDAGTYEAELRARRQGDWSGRILTRGQVFFDQAGKPVRMIGTAVDVTEQHRDAQRVIRILEGQPDAFLAVDVDWIVTHVNAGAERLLSRPRGLVMGRGLWDAVPELRGTVFAAEYERAVAEHETVTFEAQHPGTAVWVEARAHPTPDGLTIFLRDISTRRAAAEERVMLEHQREIAIGRTVRLANVAATLTESLDEETVARVVIAAAVETVGARGGAVAVLGADGLHWVAVEGDEGDLRDLVAGSPLDVPAIAATFDATGDHSVASLPLVAGGRVLGGMTLSFADARTFDTEERSFLAALADTGAQALERARLYQREHAVAETLQRALLPDRLAEPPRLAVAARYKPGTEGIEVGGDWYDVFDLGQNRVGIVLGDVVGKGIAAAAVMGRLRHVLAAFATAFDSPATVLAKVDDFLARRRSDDLATIVYGVLDTSTGELRFSSAGHLPILLAGADGVGYLPQEPGVPVGVTNHELRPEQRHRLAPGDALVLCTDGLVEDRRRSIDEGLADLAQVAGSMLRDGGDVQRACDVLLTELVGPTGGADDVALLVLRWDGPESTDHITVVLPPEVVSARRARALVAEQLTTWGEGELVEAALLCTSEVVTNAVVHAGTPVRLAIRRLARGVRIEVGDGGAAPPEHLKPDLESVHGRGVAIVAMTASAWGVELTDDGKVVWFELAAGVPSWPAEPPTWPAEPPTWPAEPPTWEAS